jgi:tetratricopeptide (TPR) repeat protein
MGEFRTAEANLRWVIMQAEAIDAKYPDTCSYLAEAYLGQGKVTQALEAAQSALAISQEMESGEFTGVAWRILGRVAGKLSPSPVRVENKAYNAAACFAESLCVFSEMGAEGERARTLRAWASYELAHGERDKGAALWQEAREIFEGLGMTLEVERMEGKPKAPG